MPRKASRSMVPGGGSAQVPHLGVGNESAGPALRYWGRSQHWSVRAGRVFLYREVLVGVVPVLDHSPGALETLLLPGVPPSVAEPPLCSGVVQGSVRCLGVRAVQHRQLEDSEGSWIECHRARFERG